MGERSVHILAAVLVTAISLQVWHTSTQDDQGRKHFDLMQKSVKKLASELAVIYNTTCGPTNCHCSQDMCTPIPDGSERSCFRKRGESNLYNCTVFLHSSLGTGDGKNCTSIKVTKSNSSATYVRLSESESTPSRIQTSAVCRTQQLDPIFQFMANETTSYFTTFYAGMIEGSLRYFPGLEAIGGFQGVCLGYDSRRRPWYNGAISHPNHLVILMDCGTDMGNDASVNYKRGSRLDVAKQFALSLMDTVYKDNYVNVFSFGASENDTFQPSTLVHFDKNDPQNHPELQSLIQKIESFILADSSTSHSQFVTGLMMALRAFDEKSNNMISTDRLLNVIVFTDGSFTDGSFWTDTSVKDVLEQVKRKHVQLFIYGINSGSSDVNLTDLSIKVGGSYRNTVIPDLINPLFSMQSYFGFLAACQRNLHGDVPLWSPNYRDYWDIGDIVTVTMPAFNGAGSFVGVAAIDILLDELGHEDEDMRRSFENEVNDKRTLQDKTTTTATNQNTAPVPVAFDDSTCKYRFEPGSNLLCEVSGERSQGNWSERNCCNSCAPPGGEGDRKIGIIIGSVIGLVLVVALLIACFVVTRWWKAKVATGTGPQNPRPTPPTDSARYGPTQWGEPL